MAKRPARDKRRRPTDPDLEELYEARDWNATWRAVFGEDIGEGPGDADDAEDEDADADDVLSLQIARAVRCAATNLVDH